MLFALQKYGFKWIFPNYVVILWPQEETPLFVENIIMLMHRLYIACLMGLLTLGLLASCKGKKEKMLTPWGEEVGGDDSVSTQKAFTLSDIQNNGELIMLTMSGPETYYDYHGRGMEGHLVDRRLVAGGRARAARGRCERRCRRGDRRPRDGREGAHRGRGLPVLLRAGTGGHRPGLILLSL